MHVIDSTVGLSRLPLVFVAAIIGGAINAIAGGGTLLTFPALLGLGVPAIVANATSTVALWPGAVSSMWGYRSALDGVRPWVIRFALPSLVGGLIGALLLLRTPPARFDALVPWLVLGATGLFIGQAPVMRWLRGRRAAAGAASPSTAEYLGTSATTEAPADVTRLPDATALAVQLVIGIYGGYFGAGIGILMLATLGFLGFTNIHRMNGLKNWGGTCTNAVAAATFAFSGLVNWPVAAAMAVGSILGGYAGSRLAQRVPQQRVRQSIVVIGLVSGLWLLANRLWPRT